MSRRLLAAVAAAALTVGLAACGDPTEGTKTDPPPSIDIGQSDGGGDGGASDGGGDEGSTEAAPDIPAPDPADYPGMDEQTPEGAEQAVRFYFANVFWGYQTGDTRVLNGLYDDGCVGCIGFRDRIEGQPDGQYWSETTVSDLGTDVQEATNYDFEVGYLFVVGEHSEPAPNSGNAVEYAAIEYISVAGVEWQSGRWVIAELTVSESSNAE
ncbi:DUF6318 family protein [Brachybacterium sp. J144]|uniref:DUF6318 family protein n=1 Tax=Brachybacterium sp. J144 TaxID=3116487 RepID=UPI002E761AC7|nr:DUF6318 family protein [Brachybacterium sp. J144]MEE1651622.1 DUF6318 family protein [Brachybacterium sp. J144]